jgi:hypothetical protein
LAALVGAVAGPSRAVTLPAPLRLPCDPLDRAQCLLPFPNDHFTVPDTSTATGRRVDFLLAEMPRNREGKPIDPTEWNRNDGFSPGSDVLTFVPGLDLRRTWGTTGLFAGDPRLNGPNDPRDQIADIARYEDPNAPIIIIDAQTGQRWPFWSELDMNAATPPSQRLLILRPAANFTEGHTYLVALRNMRNASGAIIPAGPVFAAYRDHTTPPATDVTFDKSRQAEMDRIINRIGAAETARGNTFVRKQLFLAWQFTIASERNLSERVLHIRDDAFRQLGDTNLADGVITGSPPKYAITTVTDITDDPAAQRRVEGTVTVPNYLNLPPQPTPETITSPVDIPGIGTDLPGQSIPGERFLYGTNGLPMQNPVVPTIDVPFVCTIPKAATPDDPAHPMLYGHGLLGSRDESEGGSTQRDRERNFMPCAVNWMGFADYDVLNALVTLTDPSNMASMADRAQQGFLDFLFLGRALAHPDGLAKASAFQQDGRPLFRSGELVYDGNSQGGIMGGALTALSVDSTRSVLGVVGMNYSTLLNRSDDWEGPGPDVTNPGLPSYSWFLYTQFPNKQQQQIVMALIQMLWDRAEADGYAEHMTTNPLPNTPPHQVLMDSAFGDFQVTDFAAEVEARTIGARFMPNSLPVPDKDGVPRYWGVSGPFQWGTDGLVPIPNGSWNGSGFVYWDSGNLPPPNANIPPADVGGDPHEDPRRDPNAADQKVQFWLTGLINDVMSGGPYQTCNPSATTSIPRVPSQFTTDWCL